jgi:hypothetical protein
VNLIPLSWQYPEIACARITINNDSFASDNYRDTKWRQSADIIARGMKTGVIEVVYLEEKPKMDEGPFLEEERTLINAVAVKLGEIIERDQMGKRMNHLNLVLHTISNVNQLVVREKNGKKLIQKTCDLLTELRGYYNAWIVLFDESSKPVLYAESGLGSAFLLMIEKMKRGDLTKCTKKALKRPGVIETGVGCQ